MPRRREPEKIDCQAATALKKQAEIAAFFLNFLNFLNLLNLLNLCIIARQKPLRCLKNVIWRKPYIYENAAILENREH